MTDEQRLSRIEGKLDRLADAVVTLARVEERMVTLFRRLDGSDEALRDLQERLAALERQDIGRGQFFRAVDKLAWLLIGAAVAIIAKVLGFG